MKEGRRNFLSAFAGVAAASVVMAANAAPKIEMPGPVEPCGSEKPTEPQKRESPAQRAHRWGKELSGLSRDDLHVAMSKHMTTLLDEDITEVSIRTVRTLIADYNLPIFPSQVGEPMDRFVVAFHDILSDKDGWNSKAAKLLYSSYPKG